MTRPKLPQQSLSLIIRALQNLRSAQMSRDSFRVRLIDKLIKVDSIKDEFVLKLIEDDHNHL